MPQGQQRRNNARGLIPSQDLPRLDMPWTLSTVTPTEVVLDIDPGFIAFAPGGIVQAMIVETGALPTGMTVVGQQVTLTYAAVPTSECTLHVPGNDPAVRNASGGFLGHADVALNSPFDLPLYAVVSGNFGIVATVMNHTAQDNVVCAIPATLNHLFEFFIAQQGNPGTVLVNDPSGAGVRLVSPGDCYRFYWDGVNWNSDQLV